MKGITIDLKDISDSREIMESREAPGIRYFIYILSFLIVLAVVFSCLFEIDDYTRINGEIRTYSSSSVITAGISGRISSVEVEEGQTVRKGDTLFYMDSEYSESQKKIIDDKIAEYTEELENVKKLKDSILQDKNLFDISEDYYFRYEQYLNSVKLSENEVERALKSEDASADEKKAAQENYSDSIAQKKQLIAEYNCISDCIANNHEYAGKSPSSVALLSEFYSQYEKLKNISEQQKLSYEKIKELYEENRNPGNYKEGLYAEVENTESAVFSQNEFNVTQNDIENAEKAYKMALSDEEQLKNKWITEMSEKTDALNQEIKSLEKSSNAVSKDHGTRDILGEYREISADKIKNESVISLNSEIASLNDKLESCKSQLLEINESIRNNEIKAEFDGKVTLVSQYNGGDIVQAGQQLCTLLPDENRLKANLYIPENQISKISTGQKTEYVFDALPYNQYGKITGEILSVSADSVVNEQTGMKYYLAEANLSDYSLENSKGEKREIRNGMLTEAKVISGSEKVIFWLLRKINLRD